MKPTISSTSIRMVAIGMGFAAALSGCSQKAEPSHTVDEFVIDQTMLAEEIARCRNDPGMLRETPNCRNAEAADGKSRLERMRKALEE